MSWSERELLQWLRAQAGCGAGVELGIGDDAAVLQPPYGGALVSAADQTVENVHFRRDSATWEEVGRKALARNLSDLAAMAARPWTVLAGGTDIYPAATEAFAWGRPGPAHILDLSAIDGLSDIDETADALKISPATVKRDWQFASAWLQREVRTTLMH